jgi:hypothetical protein
MEPGMACCHVKEQKVSLSLSLSFFLLSENVNFVRILQMAFCPKEKRRQLGDTFPGVIYCGLHLLRKDQILKREYCAYKFLGVFFPQTASLSRMFRYKDRLINHSKCS